MKFDSTEAIQIRSFHFETDDIDALTSLLHKAYKQLGDMGLRYVATHQDSNTTRNRIEGGQCLIGMIGNRMVATITYYPPGVKAGCAWYSKPAVGTFGQFGVLPELQGSGIGGKLLNAVEDMALRDGCKELALDTAEPALHLHKYYQRRGYRLVDHVNWESTNYRSVIMSKRLGE